MPSSYLARHEKAVMKVLAENRLDLTQGYLKDPDARLEKNRLYAGIFTIQYVFALCKNTHSRPQQLT
jgi:hypothetical protein